jgi:uncharacterized protein (DUF1800 family)
MLRRTASGTNLDEPARRGARWHGLRRDPVGAGAVIATDVTMRIAIGIRPWLPTLCLVLVACATGSSPPTPPAASGPPPLTESDLRWLNRVTFGVDSATVARYRQLGRARFLDEQLRPPPADPPDLAAAIAAIAVTRQSAEQLVRTARAEQQRINALADESEKQQARQARNQLAAQATYETAKRHLLRALHSPAQLREQMTWFWMNHFNVFAGKGLVRWMLPDYEERSVRPQALGRFRDLVLTTVKSPAMLEYLDNAQSSVGRINENYARELMELHTLGVSGGPSGSRYGQGDVQELARVLTGVGINATDAMPKLPPARQGLYLRDGLFEFNPNRHDFGAKMLLNERIAGAGFSEVEEVVTLLTRQLATARFISRKLATYFAADDPPPALVEAMAETFRRADGDIAAVLRTMFLAREFTGTLTGPQGGPGKFKDPLPFVVSSLRLAYDGKVISNYRPVVGWLAQLGQPLYGRVTPDGYPLMETAWTSSGQLVKRFEIARAIGAGSAGLFNTDDNTPGPRVGFPVLNNRLFYEAIEPTLSARTREALARTASQQEWNSVLLASPDWMQR